MRTICGAHNFSVWLGDVWGHFLSIHVLDKSCSKPGNKGKGLGRATLRVASGYWGISCRQHESPGGHGACAPDLWKVESGPPFVHSAEVEGVASAPSCMEDAPGCLTQHPLSSCPAPALATILQTPELYAEVSTLAHAPSA